MVEPAADAPTVPAAVLVCLSAVVLLLLLVVLCRGRSRKPNLPPSPPSLPFLGNLLQLVDDLPHRSLWRLALKYGPLMYLKLGQVPTLVVSNADMAQEILREHDAHFCTRPARVATTRFSYGGLGVAFAPYSEGWRQLRRIGTLELYSAKRVQSFRPIREQEMLVLVDTVAATAAAGRLVNLTETFLCLYNNITCRLAFGRRASNAGECGRSRFHGLLMESMELLGGFCASDFFPSMGWLNVLSTGFHARLEKAFHSLDTFLEEEIESHLLRRNAVVDDDDRDLLSVLLRLQKDLSLGFNLTRNHIKAVLLEVFFAGSDTSASTTEFAMMELARHPRVMKKAQEEVRRVVGNKPMVEESDLAELGYLKLVVKEILRFRPSVPLPFPHESMRDVRVGGYDVPAKTMVFINIWAICRDPNFWEDPEVFWPERFEGSRLQYKGQNFQYIPFSSGRRICPGINLGVTVVELALASLLHRFDWEQPDGMKPDDIDTTESFGLVLHLKSPLMLKAIPILQ